MKATKCDLGVAAVLAALWAIAPAHAAEIRRFDGIHRIAKQSAQVTDRAVLAPRADSPSEGGSFCDTGSKLCPASLNGGCCPSAFDCAKSSCVATTKGPSMCGDKVGWYVCDAVYGAGSCCPDGYICDVGDACVPPSDSPYTYGCPQSQYLCPEEMNYGCCNIGMACGKNQCYSTEPVTTTITRTVVTTREGERTTVRNRVTSVSTPDSPTAFPTVDGGDSGDQKVFKFYPSAVSKALASSTSSAADNEGGGGGGLSTGALAGIIAGSVAFLILVGVGAFIIIRHLNKVVAAVGSNTGKTESSKSRPTMKEYKPTDSEGDALSVDPLMLPTRPRNPGPEAHRQSGSEFSSNNVTPNIGVGGYHPVGTTPGDSRGTSFDANNPQHGDDYFRTGAAQLRVSQQSAVTTPTSLKHVSDDSRNGYQHVRHWSNASDSTDGNVTELEATERIQELPYSPASSVFPPNDRRRSTSTIASIQRPSVVQQRRSSGQRGRSESFGQSPPLGMVSEEIHGFHGPSGRFVGQTNTARPKTQETIEDLAPDEPPNRAG